MSLGKYTITTTGSMEEWENKLLFLERKTRERERESALLFPLIPLFQRDGRRREFSPLRSSWKGQSRKSRAISSSSSHHFNQSSTSLPFSVSEQQLPHPSSSTINLFYPLHFFPQKKIVKRISKRIAKLPFSDPESQGNWRTLYFNWLSSFRSFSGELYAAFLYVFCVDCVFLGLFLFLSFPFFFFFFLVLILYGVVGWDSVIVFCYY